MVGIVVTAVVFLAIGVLIGVQLNKADQTALKALEDREAEALKKEADKIKLN